MFVGLGIRKYLFSDPCLLLSACDGCTEYGSLFLLRNEKATINHPYQNKSKFVGHRLRFLLNEGR